MAGLIEDKLRGSVEVTGGAQRPLPVVQVQSRSGRAQVHAGGVIGVDGADVAPVGILVKWVAGDVIGLEIVGEHFDASDQAGQDVASKIVRTGFVCGVRVEFAQEQVGGKNVI